MTLPCWWVGQVMVAKLANKEMNNTAHSFERLIFGCNTLIRPQPDMHPKFTKNMFQPSRLLQDINRNIRALSSLRHNKILGQYAVIREAVLGQYAVIREAVLTNIHRQTREKTE